MSRRRDNLPISFHQEVAGLEIEEQDLLLDTCESENWTRPGFYIYIMSETVNFTPRKINFGIYPTKNRSNRFSLAIHNSQNCHCAE